MIRWALGCCPSPRWPLCSSTQPLKTLRRRRTSAAATNVKKLVSAGRTVTQSVGGKDNKAPDWAATRFFLIIKHVQSMEKWQHVRNRKAPSLPNADCAGSHRWDPWVWCGQSLKSMMCFFKHTIQCLWYSTKEKSQVPLGCFYPSIQSIVLVFEDSLKEKIKQNELKASACTEVGRHNCAAHNPSKQLNENTSDLQLTQNLAECLPDGVTHFSKSLCTFMQPYSSVETKDTCTVWPSSSTHVSCVNLIILIWNSAINRTAREINFCFIPHFYSLMKY